MLRRNKIILLSAVVIIPLLAIAFLAHNGIFRSKTKNNCSIDVENERLPSGILLDTESGNNFFDKLQNEKALLIFMMTECAGCQIESQIVSAALPRIGSNIKIYGVVRERKNEVDNFIKNHAVNFPILIDKDGKMFEQLKIKCTPMNLITENGVIKKVLLGSPKDEKMLLDDLEIAN